MIAELLSLMSLLDAQRQPMGGIYCDEVASELIEYQQQTGAFTQEQLKDLIGNCEIWEEEYEEEVDSGAVKPIEK